MEALARMCRGKERIDPYTARKRGERTGRGWYHCSACNYSHQTRTRPGPGAYIIRDRARGAITALIEHRGEAWLASLVGSWDPTNGATPRSGDGTHCRPDAGTSHSVR
jgi:hypothetical protein